MGKSKTGKWLKNFFSGRRDSKEKINSIISDNNNENFPTTPISVPNSNKEKGRWSFRRSSATAPRNSSSSEHIAVVTTAEDQQKQHALAVAAATAAAADAAVAAAQAAAAVIRLTAATATGTPSIIEEAAAIKIQAAYRSYLARKALRALKGLVKLQALVRGHLVRKQAKATLRCMQTLVTLQAKVLAQRVRTTDDMKPRIPMPPTNRHQSPNARLHQIHHVVDKVLEENIKIVEMDVGELKGRRRTRNSYSVDQEPRTAANRMYCSELDDIQPSVTTPSALSEFSPRTCSGHFDDHHSFRTAQSSPHFSNSVPKSQHMNNIPLPYPQHEYAESLPYDYPDYYPNYMANTQSSRAKARSQSAPKQRPPESFERQSSRRRPSVEGRNSSHPNNIPRAVRMQRSSSNLSATAHNFQCPPAWAMKLDRSAMSVRDSECESVSTVLTNTEYCRSLAGYEIGNARRGGLVVPR